MARDLVADLKQLVSQHPGLDPLGITQRLRGAGWSVSTGEVKAALHANLASFQRGAGADGGWHIALPLGRPRGRRRRRAR